MHSMPQFIPVGVRSPAYTQQALHGDESGDVLAYRLRVHTQLINSQFLLRPCGTITRAQGIETTFSAQYCVV